MMQASPFINETKKTILDACYCNIHIKMWDIEVYLLSVEVKHATPVNDKIDNQQRGEQNKSEDAKN